MGDRDTRDPNIERLLDNIVGASADYVNRADLDDTQKYHVGKAIGKPTNVLPDGSRIQAHQKKKRKRQYSGKLHKARTQSLPVLQRSVSPKPPLPNDVLAARAKKKLR